MFPRLAVVVLAACAAHPQPPAAFAAALARAGSGFVEREAGAIVRGAVPCSASALPRGATVTIRTLQPGGEMDALEQVFVGDEALFFARHRYADATTPSRSVLVAGDGRVIERSHEVPAAGDDPTLAPALRAAQAALGEPTARVEIVHGAPGSEWLRVSGSARIVDCALDGAVRSVREREIVTQRP